MAKFLDRLLGKDEKQQLIVNAGQTFKLVSGYEPQFTSWQGEIYESQIVRAAIDARARHISKLKFEVVGNETELLKRLKVQPNPWNSWSSFLYRVSTILDCCNNCILIPIYDQRFNQIGIYPLTPTKVKVVSYKDELWVTYDFQNGRKRGACKLAECVILTRFQFKNDFFGENNDVLDDTMNLIKISNQGITEAVKSTASYKFMASLTNFSKMDDLQKERENFSEAAFGSEAKQKGGILLFPNTYKDIKQIDLKPYTPDKDQMNLINQSVYDYFGVNEDILQNKAIGDSWSAFFEGCIEPFAIQFSENLGIRLFNLEERANGSKILLTANRLQYMSFNDRLNYVQGMSDRGIITIDEAREVFSLAPLPNDTGKVLPRRGEYALLDPEKGTDLQTKEDEGGTE